MSQRGAVLEGSDQAGPAEAMIRRLAGLRGVGVQTATALVRDGFVRTFRSAKALGSYAGLVGTPFASGQREGGQGHAPTRHGQLAPLRTMEPGSPGRCRGAGAKTLGRRHGRIVRRS
jgi:transposase